MSSANTDIIFIDELARMLDVSEKTVRRNLKRWPHARMGRKIIFSRSAVLEKISQPMPERSQALRMRPHPSVDF